MYSLRDGPEEKRLERDLNILNHEAYIIVQMLIPNAPSPMMWQHLLASSLLLLCRVIQEEIYQDRIHLRLRMLPQYLLLNKLNAPNTAAYTILLAITSTTYIGSPLTSNLDLPRVPTLNQPFTPHRHFQRRTIPQTP